MSPYPLWTSPRSPDPSRTSPSIPLPIVDLPQVPRPVPDLPEGLPLVPDLPEAPPTCAGPPRGSPNPSWTSPEIQTRSGGQSGCPRGVGRSTEDPRGAERPSWRFKGPVVSLVGVERPTQRFERSQEAHAEVWEVLGGPPGGSIWSGGPSRDLGEVGGPSKEL